MPVTPGFARVASRVEALFDHLPGGRILVGRTPARGVAQMNLFHEVCARMRAMDKVVIAAINGRAMGGGCELTLACDLRLMTDGSVEGGQMLGQPEIYLRLIPGGGGTQMLTRLLGVGRALELCLEGRLLSPKEACDLGLVHRVVAAAELRRETFGLADRMSRRSPFAVRDIKRAVYQAASLSFDDGMEIEKVEFMSAATQASTRRAMTAYSTFVGDLVRSGMDLGVQHFHRWMDGTAVDLR